MRFLLHEIIYKESFNSLALLIVFNSLEHFTGHVLIVLAFSSNVFFITLNWIQS